MLRAYQFAGRRQQPRRFRFSCCRGSARPPRLSVAVVESLPAPVPIRGIVFVKLRGRQVHGGFRSMCGPPPKPGAWLPDCPVRHSPGSPITAGSCPYRSGGDLPAGPDGARANTEAIGCGRSVPRGCATSHDGQSWFASGTRNRLPERIARDHSQCRRRRRTTAWSVLVSRSTAVWTGRTRPWRVVRSGRRASAVFIVDCHIGSERRCASDVAVMSPAVSRPSRCAPTVIESDQPRRACRTGRGAQGICSGRPRGVDPGQQEPGDPCKPQREVDREGSRRQPLRGEW